MNTNYLVDAEIFVSGLKVSIDEIWDRHIKNTSRDDLLYVDGNYGMLQHEEIGEILGLISSLKEHVDFLYEECRSMPEEQRLERTALRY